jgi:putative tryptophan/tyrosine transport system substrate-binding protein
MKRREFIGVLGEAAAWPLVARGQQPAIPVIGYLSSGSPEPFAIYLEAFRKGLGVGGYTEGRNVVIEYRWALGQYDKLPALATELVDRRVNVIASTGGNIALQAAKNATAAIPIVFTLGNDPLGAGVVSSLSRPGGNVTGVTFFNSTLLSKRLALLHELLPGAKSVALLLGPDPLSTAEALPDAEAAATKFGLELHAIKIGNENDLESAFDKLAEQRIGAVLEGADPFFLALHKHFVALATRYAIPAMSAGSATVKLGALIAYDTNIADTYHDAGIYVAKILNGAKPGELPITQPVNFRLTINLKTAKALGLTVPASLLALADEVIE